MQVVQLIALPLASAVQVDGSSHLCVHMVLPTHATVQWSALLARALGDDERVRDVRRVVDGEADGEDEVECRVHQALVAATLGSHCEPNECYHRGDVWEHAHVPAHAEEAADNNVEHPQAGEPWDRKCWIHKQRIAIINGARWARAVEQTVVGCARQRKIACRAIAGIVSPIAAVAQPLVAGARNCAHGSVREPWKEEKAADKHRPCLALSHLAQEAGHSEQSLAQI